MRTNVQLLQGAQQKIPPNSIQLHTTTHPTINQKPLQLPPDPAKFLQTLSDYWATFQGEGQVVHIKIEQFVYLMPIPKSSVDKDNYWTRIPFQDVQPTIRALYNLMTFYEQAMIDSSTRVLPEEVLIMNSILVIIHFLSLRYEDEFKSDLTQNMTALKNYFPSTSGDLNDPSLYFTSARHYKRWLAIFNYHKSIHDHLASKTSFGSSVPTLFNYDIDIRKDKSPDDLAYGDDVSAYYRLKYGDSLVPCPPENSIYLRERHKSFIQLSGQNPTPNLEMVNSATSSLKLYLLQLVTCPEFNPRKLDFIKALNTLIEDLFNTPVSGDNLFFINNLAHIPILARSSFLPLQYSRYPQIRGEKNRSVKVAKIEVTSYNPAQYGVDKETNYVISFSFSYYIENKLLRQIVHEPAPSSTAFSALNSAYTELLKGRVRKSKTSLQEGEALRREIPASLSKNAPEQGKCYWPTVNTNCFLIVY